MKWQARFSTGYEWYSTDKMSGTKRVMKLVLEQHAYTWDAAERKFGTDYGAQKMLQGINSELKDLGL